MIGSALASTLAEVAAALADLPGDGPAHAATQTRLDALVTVAEAPLLTPFARAVDRAADRLHREGGPAAAPLLHLLADPRPAPARLRAVAVEELLLAAEPDLARLAELYRRDLRPALAANGTEPPPWRHAGPALIRLLGELVPAALSDQPRLRRLLPEPAERAVIDELRSGLTRPARPLAETFGQSISASNGANIAHIRQLVVHGDLYEAPATPAPDLALLYARYRAFIVESFSSLDFRGLLQIQAAARVCLEQVYIPVDARPLQGEGAPASLHQFVCEQPLLVVLGDPGSGKSTLVRYILLSLTRGNAREQLGLEPLWLPIYVPVAAFAAARARPGHADLAPLDYLADYYRGLSQPDYSPLFAHALALGHALVLLDGLDEVREGRQGVVRALEAFAREWDATGNRFLATSRSVGYAEAPLDPDLFAAAMIEPLSEAQIRLFIERWSRAYARLGEAAAPPAGDLLDDLVHEAALVERERRIARHSTALAEAVFAEPFVAELARKPLLLTILALIHNQGARLPDRRADLYRLCVAALAESWNRARSLTGRPVDVYLGDEPLDERFVVNLLGPVALWLHGEQAGGLVDQDDLETRIAATLEQADGIPRGRARRLAGDFIELVRRETGLLQERGYRRFGFLHLTFEEYLAARGLLESLAVENPDELLRRYAVDPGWREVVRLAVAAASQRETGRMLQAILAAPAEGSERGRPALLAGECLLDVGRNGAGGRAWELVVTALLGLLADGEAPVATRIAGGLTLGRLGDPRRLDPLSGRAVGSDEPATLDYWCDVAAGPFWRGDDGRGRKRGPGLSPAELPYSLRIGRYLVSNAEYRRFIEAGGYSTPRWWTPEGLSFLNPDRRRNHNDSENGPINGPALWETAHLNNPAQPVVGVAWYEAAAYCAWLTELGRSAGWLYPGEILRLPTALEWERAARHTDRRAYPWGDEPPDPTRASYEAGGLRAPAPVGAFPAGAAACGALDLAGNVWEWTASRSDQLAELTAWSDMGRKQSPAIKGGAFNWGADALRCGAYYWFQPARRYNLLGFRLVWVAAPEGMPT